MILLKPMIVFLVLEQLVSLAIGLAMKTTITIQSTEINVLKDMAISALERSENQRVFIAIAGCPGSGKSTIADKICHAINGSGLYKARLIPMDGYHIPKAELRRMGEMGSLVDDSLLMGSTVEKAQHSSRLTYDDLMNRRGAPWTIDSIQLIDDLIQLKALTKKTFPSYSREISDPIPDSITVYDDEQIIICEGNYLLCYNDPAWSPLMNYFDESWYVDVPLETMKERLIKRHLQRWTTEKAQRFGEGWDGAAAKVELSDLKNAVWIMQNSKRYANVIIDNGSET